MNVAAENGVHPVSLRITHNRVFKFADEIDRVLDSLLRVGAERPIAETEAAADEIDQRIQRKQKLVTKIAGESEPARVLHDRIQFVSMNDQNAPSIGGGMDEVFRDRDVAVVAAEATEEFVVVTGDINDARALARFAQEFLDDVVMLLRPIDSAPHLPDIDQIADDVERLEIVVAQEFQERCGVAAAGPEVDVGNPGGAQAAKRGVLTTRKFRLREGGSSVCILPRQNSRRASSRQRQFCYVSVSGQA